MVDLGSIALEYRLFIAVGVMIGPSLLFLGLYRFLEWLRDDRMIAQVAQHEDVTDSLEPTPGDVIAEVLGADAPDVIRCRHCGAPTVPEAAGCLECGQSP